MHASARTGFRKDVRGPQGRGRGEGDRRRERQRERVRSVGTHTVTEYTNENPRRDEAKPLFSLDNGGVEVTARVSLSYLAGTIYRCFFSRCLANVRHSYGLAIGPDL